MPAFNKGNVIRGGFGSTFLRIVCHGDYKDRVRDRARGRRNLGNLNVLVIVFVMICKNLDIARPFGIKPLFKAVEACAMGRLLFCGLTLCAKGDNLCSDVTT